MIDIMREHDLDPRIWCTELGWAMHEFEPWNAPRCAAVRGLLPLRLSLWLGPCLEAEKLCWFGFSYPGYESGYTYGLFQKLTARANPRLQDGEWFPTSSAASYATCARLLDDVTFIDEFKLGTMVYGFRFRNETAEKDIVAMWVDEPHSTGGSATLTLPSGAPEPELTVDAFGREYPASPSVKLQPLPVFLVVPADEGGCFCGGLEKLGPASQRGFDGRATGWVTRENAITVGLG